MAIPRWRLRQSEGAECRSCDPHGCESSCHPTHRTSGPDGSESRPIALDFGGKLLSIEGEAYLGCKQPKQILAIEVTNTNRGGYWRSAAATGSAGQRQDRARYDALR